jgi:rhamnogalacturonyl hydrolase YesR
MEHWSEAKIAQLFQDLKNKNLLREAARKDIQDYIEALCKRHRARGNFMYKHY